MLLQVKAIWPAELAMGMRLAEAAWSAPFGPSKAKPNAGTPKLRNGSWSGSSATTTQRSGLEGSETSSTASPEDVARTCGAEKNGRMLEVNLTSTVTGVVPGLVNISK